MSLPQLLNIPEIDFNYEGLKRHAHLIIFIPEPELSQDDRKKRAWFLHTVVSACRHYTNARELVSKQESADQVRDGGAVLYIYDVSEHLENCITAIYRANRASYKMFPTYDEEHNNIIKKVSDLRNQFDHMYNNVVSGQTGKGPISVSYTDEGNNIQFRSKKVLTKEIFTLLKALYLSTCSMFTKFNSSSPAEAGGPPVLKMSLQISNGNIDEKQS